MDIAKTLRESCFCEGRGCELCRAADEIESLRAELTELRARLEDTDSACADYAFAGAHTAREIIEKLHDRLRAELSACQQDAERYRWLRHPRMGWDIVHKTEVGLVCAEYLACVELDAAIDAARKGEGK